MDKYNIYKNCSFVFGSCDAYSFLWDNFFKLLFKYFPSSKKFKFYGMVENDYLYDGVVVKGYHASLKNNSFSSRLIEALKNVDTEFIIFFLDDFYLEGKVNEEYIFSSFNLLFEDKNIGHIVLHDFQKEMDVGKKDYNDSFVIMDKRASFRISAQCSFWRKDYLLKILRKYEDAWEFEFNGTYRSRYYKEIYSL